MPSSTNVTNLKINELTEAQYDTAVQQGIIGANELSVLTDAEAGQVIQVATMPTAAVGELDKIYQFIGTTDANYTNGYFYKCVSDGQDPATYSWTQTDVQPQAGGLPSQTGQSGKFLTTDGTDASWSDKPLVNAATDNNTALSILGTVSSVGAAGVGIGYNSKTYKWGVAIGSTASVDSLNTIAIGFNSRASAKSAICIGSGARASALGAIQLSGTTNTSTNNDANTFKVANANGNYEIMSADGTIPTDRFTTTPVSDGTYVPTLTVSSGTATRTWGAAASAPVVPATMPTLAVADWSSNTQTVNVTGVTASNIVFVSPAPASAADYAAAGIVCTAQGSGTLTFTCTTVPTNAITVNVVILG